MSLAFSRALAAAALGVTLSWSHRGAAQWAVGLDSHVAEKGGQWTGGGGDVRFGVRLGLPRSFIVHSVIIQPEAIAGYHQLPFWAQGAHVGRFGAGGRIGLTFNSIEPFFVVHESLVDATGRWGGMTDYGGALDFRLPTWSIGAHYARNEPYGAPGKLGFNEVGLHLEVRGYWFFDGSWP